MKKFSSLFVAVMVIGATCMFVGCGDSDSVVAPSAELDSTELSQSSADVASKSGTGEVRRSRFKTRFVQVGEHVFYTMTRTGTPIFITSKSSPGRAVVTLMYPLSYPRWYGVGCLGSRIGGYYTDGSSHVNWCSSTTSSVQLQW